MRFLLTLVLALSSASAFASNTAISADAPAGSEWRIEIQLDGANAPVQLNLTPTQVWTDDARIAVHSSSGTRYVAPLNDRYFSGEIAGEKGSNVVLRVGADGSRLGLIASNGGSWMIHQDDRHDLHTVALHDQNISHKAFNEHFDCDVLTPPSDVKEFFATRPLQPQTTASSHSASTSATKAIQYEARVAVETDHELMVRLGGSVADTSRYITDLFAFISGVYESEVNTAVTVSHLSLWEDSNDPWTQTGTVCALNEVSYFWNNNRTDIDRTIAHFISGKNMGGGVAWLGVLCRGEFAQSNVNCPGLPSSGNFGGAYGVSAGIRGSFDSDNPQVVWDFTVIAHEIGHNFNSPHTHCYAGIGGNADPVDRCYGGEGDNPSCHAGTGVLPDPGVAGSGTIMSYCHLLSGGQSNISPTFGLGHPYGTQPERVPSRMFSHVQSRAGNNPSCLAPRATGPGFRLILNRTEQSACINGATLAPINVQTQTVGGFDGDIALTVDPVAPAGLSANFSDATIAAGGTTELNLDINAGASAGDVTFNVVASANGADTQVQSVTIDLFDELAGTPSLALPNDNATGLSLLPDLSWSTVNNADAYRVQLAEGPAMNSPLFDDSTADPSWQPGSELNSNQDYFWRVRALSSCGDSTWSEVRQFRTGNCATSLDQGFETDLNNWQTTQDGNGAHWAVSAQQVSDGAQSAFSTAPGAVSDRQLTSPRMALPANADVQLRFDSWMAIERSNGTCWDGALLEIAVGDGAFSSVPENLLTQGNYDGTLPSNYGNPAAGQPAWCGNSNGFEVIGADLSGYAGQEIRLRWRVATDSGVNAEGWYIDNVAITSCGGDTPGGSFALNLRIEGSGELVSAAGGLQCSGQCQFDRPANETITLLPEADGGHVFERWLDECAGSAEECTLSMDQARTAGARFSPDSGPIFMDRFEMP